MGGVIVVRATRRLLGRLTADSAGEGDASTTVLGDWYATLLPWRPRLVALFISERTLPPVQLTPAGSVLDRFPSQLGDVLAGVGANGRQHRGGGRGLQVRPSDAHLEPQCARLHE